MTYVVDRKLKYPVTIALSGGIMQINLGKKKKNQPRYLIATLISTT